MKLSAATKEERKIFVVDVNKIVNEYQNTSNKFYLLKWRYLLLQQNFRIDQHLNILTSNKLIERTRKRNNHKNNPHDMLHIIATPHRISYIPIHLFISYISEKRNLEERIVWQQRSQNFHLFTHSSTIHSSSYSLCALNIEI